MQIIQSQVNEEAKNFGINIVDVRIKRADLPPANSEAIYKRMQTEREREAKEFRAQGAEIAQKIRSTADKDVTVILAQANKKSEIMKGEGDGQRNKIFANAFGSSTLTGFSFLSFSVSPGAKPNFVKSISSLSSSNNLAQNPFNCIGFGICINKIAPSSFLVIDHTESCLFTLYGNVLLISSIPCNNNFIDFSLMSHLTYDAFTLAGNVT